MMLALIHLAPTGFAGSVVPDYPPKLEVTVSLIPSDTNVEEIVTLCVSHCAKSTMTGADYISAITRLIALMRPYV